MRAAAYYELVRSEVLDRRWDAVGFECMTISISHILPSLVLCCCAASFSACLLKSSVACGILELRKKQSRVVFEKMRKAIIWYPLLRAACIDLPLSF